MSLAQTLTNGRLRIMAGYAFPRGELYWREGKVLAWEVNGDTLAGTIAGTVTYEARLVAQNGMLVAKCTCPVEDAICKHAVALGMAYLHRDNKPPAEAPAAATTGFAIRADMVRWAEEHGVAHALMLSSEVLLPGVQARVPHSSVLAYTLGRIAVRDMGAREGAMRYVGAHGIVEAITSAAAELLEREAALVRDGLAEEVARVARDEPLWNKLDALRRTIRLHGAMPRSRAARASGTWGFDPTGAAISWKERPRILRTGEDYGAAVLATRLEIGGGGEARVECSCRALEGRCTHALALIDATLDVLEDPARADDARRMAEELLRPGWARALLELERVDVHAVKPKVTIELWWQLEDELGGLSVSALVKKLTKRGLSPGAKLSAQRLLDEYRDHLDERDLIIAEHAAAWSAERSASTYPVRALAALVGHPRVMSDDEPVVVLRAQLGFSAFASGDSIRLEPAMCDPPKVRERMSPKLLGALLTTFAPGEPLVVPDPDGGRYILVDASDEARRVWAALSRHGDVFPPEAHAQLLDRLARMEARVPIDVADQLKGAEVGAAMTTVVRLRLLPDTALELELFVRPAPGAPLFAPGAGPRDVMVGHEHGRGYVRRNLGEELPRAREAIAHLPMDGADEGPPLCFRMPSPDAALALVAALQVPVPGLEVEWIDGLALVAGRAEVTAVRLRVNEERDWFGVAGELKVEAGRVELALVLDAVRRQRKYVRLDEHRWVELSETLRQQLQALADQTFVGRNRLELSPGAVPAISALDEAGAQVEAAKAWQELSAKLTSARALRPKPPAALAATLRDYQVEGHAWLTRVAAWGAGACLADDMGLGKTVQAIAVLIDRARARHGPALVLAPTSVAFNWVDELARFAPSLRPIVYREQADRAACLADLGNKDVVIASYGLLVNDHAQLAARTWGTLVVDEAQALKNAGTRRAKAARALRAKFRIALSGTPFENHLGELWSLYAIVFPGLLGSWDQFRERFAFPIEKVGDPDARAALSRVLRPFLLRRTKAEVARELPPRTEIDVSVALSADEWSLYEDARLAAIAEVSQETKVLREEQRRFAVLAALTRLRLLASHPKLYDPTSPIASSKMKRLVELLEELRSEGHRALVFSQFTSHLALVRDELGRAGITTLYLDGQTPVPQRAKLVKAFQDGDADAFLISTKAGGTGINLTAADYVIHLDPWWNPAVEDQATDRAHRIGQDRPVTVYRLITRGTIEEKILAMHRDKRALVAGVLEGSGAAARLSTRDLLALLAGGGKAEGEGDDDGDDDARAAGVG
ncbi:MAG: DEAD/DEAH box helicase [Deltaproteobacteria bacterium]|nr:DEAD/DEAH box helicase [Deltaproteobacteria bacterium]